MDPKLISECVKKEPGVVTGVKVVEVVAMDDDDVIVCDDTNVKTVDQTSSKMKKKSNSSKRRVNSCSREEAIGSQIPLTVKMSNSASKSVEPFVLSTKQSQNVKHVRKPLKLKCPGKKITSSFKVTSVKPSMLFKTTNLKSPGAQIISADGVWQDMAEECQLNEDTAVLSNDSDMENEIPFSPPVEIDGETSAQSYISKSDVEFHFLFGNVILHIKHPGSLPFWGQLHVEVIKGAVEVLGYTLTPSKGSHIVFSPRGSSLLPIQTAVAEGNDLCNTSCMDVDVSQLESLFQTGGENDAWLYLKKVDSLLPSFLDRYLPFKLFPSAEMIQRDKTFPNAAKKLHCIFDIPSSTKCFEKGDQWNILHERVHKSDCTVLCGGKGVGKSTMLRFLVNQLLTSSQGSVVLLDFDPGQAETTVPGCVSLSLVSKPLLGPNFTHLQKSEKCIYIGEVNVSNCVTRYIDACASLINFWHSNSLLRGVPCIVNTMGFTQGLGVTLIVQLLSLLKPNLVIQIESFRAAHNFPDVLSVDYVKRNCSTSPFAPDVDAQLFALGVRPVCSHSINYDLLVLKAVTEKDQDKTFGPRQLREIVIMSYLSQATSSPSHSILDVVPYSCPLDDLRLNVCHQTVDPSLTLSVLNASLVALCHASPSQEDVVQVSAPGVPAVITRPLIADCYGFGIVRGIDMDSKCLFITTPLDSCHLASINCLMLGAVTLPSSMLLNPPKESGPVPYVAVVRTRVANLATQQPLCLNPVFDQ